MTIKPQILLSNEYHNDRPVDCIRYRHNQITGRLKESAIATGSVSRRFWFSEKSGFKLNMFFECFRDLAYIDYSAVSVSVEAVKKETKKQKYIIVSMRHPEGIKNPLDDIFDNST